MCNEKISSLIITYTLHIEHYTVPFFSGLFFLLTLRIITLCGAVVQLGAHLNGIQEVRGSIPLCSTILLRPSVFTLGLRRNWVVRKGPTKLSTKVAQRSRPPLLHQIFIILSWPFSKEKEPYQSAPFLYWCIRKAAIVFYVFWRLSFFFSPLRYDPLPLSIWQPKAAIIRRPHTSTDVYLQFLLYTK